MDNAARILENTAVVLVEPKYAENVGAAARSAANMGIRRLILVRRELPDRERMLKMATHHAADLVDNLTLYPDLAPALESFSWVVGTSARLGRQRLAVVNPRSMVGDLVPRLAHNRVALVFGPEHRGLTNDDLKLCNMVTSIPTADFSSLNLAQAVAVVTYELYAGVLSHRREGKQAVPKLANSHEMEAMYRLLEETLRHTGTLKETDYGYWMRNIRHFLGRIGLRAREVKFVKGFCRQVLQQGRDKAEETEKS